MNHNVIDVFCMGESLNSLLAHLLTPLKRSVHTVFNTALAVVHSLQCEFLAISIDNFEYSSLWAFALLEFHEVSIGLQNRSLWPQPDFRLRNILVFIPLLNLEMVRLNLAH